MQKNAWVRSVFASSVLAIGGGGCNSSNQPTMAGPSTLLASVALPATVLSPNDPISTECQPVVAKMIRQLVERRVSFATISNSPTPDRNLWVQQVGQTFRAIGVQIVVHWRMEHSLSVPNPDSTEADGGEIEQRSDGPAIGVLIADAASKIDKGLVRGPNNPARAATLGQLQSAIRFGGLLPEHAGGKVEFPPTSWATPACGCVVSKLHCIAATRISAGQPLDRSMMAPTGIGNGRRTSGWS
jgi:hypothetical protein